MVSPILEALINFCKDKKIIKKKKKFIHPDEVKQRFLTGYDVAQLTEEINQNNKIKWDIEEYYKNGGKIRNKRYDVIKEKVEFVASIITIPFKVVSKAIDVAAWYSTSGSDAIHRAMGRKKAPSLADYLFRDKVGKINIKEKQGYKKLVEIIEFDLVINGLQYEGETQLYMSEEDSLRVYFSYIDMLHLGYIEELLKIPNPDINKVMKFQSKFLKYLHLNTRTSRVMVPGDLLKEKVRETAKIINREILNSKFDEKTAKYVINNVYVIISGLIPLLSNDFKERLFTEKFLGESKEEKYVNREIEVIIKPIFYQRGTINVLIENILTTNVEVQEIISRHVRGQEIKQALLNLENYVKQMIQNTTKVD